MPLTINSGKAESANRNNDYELLVAISLLIYIGTSIIKAKNDDVAANHWSETNMIFLMNSGLNKTEKLSFYFISFLV